MDRAGHALAALLLLVLLVHGPTLAAGERFADEWPRTDFSKSLVDLDEIRSGGPPKDGIPAIDAPRFVSPEQAARWLDPLEPVLLVEVEGEARAYPLQILIWHEIVNDRIAGVPVAVTFCPLCNAGIVFDRRVGGIEGGTLDFGTTGKLRKSDLVMYDRQTESWWQQFTGEAIIGALAGRELTPVPAPVISFADARDAYPDLQVLSRETGHDRDYGRNPYRGYDRVGNQPFLLDDPADPRLPAMERVLGVSHAGTHKLYPLSDLRTSPVRNDQVGALPVVVLAVREKRSALDARRIAASRTVPAAAAYDRRLGGRALTFALEDGLIVDRETGSTWDPLGHAVAGPLAGERLRQVDAGVHFAFAWLAFRPESTIDRGPGG
jgi:hypothetical protein